MIVFFSGTGNSKCIAMVIAKALGDSVIDSSEYLKTGDFPTLTSKEPYVFVCPTYAWRIPKVFENWITKSTFKGTQDAYFVMTCGDGIDSAELPLKKLCERKGFRFRGVHKIDMPENYICMFKAPPPEKAEAIIAKGKATAQALASDYIARGAPFPEAKGKYVLTYVLNPLFYLGAVNDKSFVATDFCIGCGICEAYCPLANITMEDGKPKWHGNCTQCQACINICPREAIEYGNKTQGKLRYFLKEDD